MKKNSFEKNECKGMNKTERAKLEFEMKQVLQQYTVEYPDERQIDATVDMLRRYVPTQRNHLLYEKVFSVLKMAGQEFSQIGSLFWISNALFFLLGAIAIFVGRLNPYLTAMCIAPIPIIFGTFEVFKSWHQGMAELELTMRHSLQEILLSKMVIVGSFNLLLNVLLTFILSLLTNDIWLWKLIIYWITPFTVVSAIAFIIASKVRNGYATVTTSLVVWVGISCGTTISEHTKPWLENVHVFYYIILNVLAVTVLLFQIYWLTKRNVLLKIEERRCP